MTNPTTCELCGEPMPAGEEMFNYHGYSGLCPKPPKAKTEAPTEEKAAPPQIKSIQDWLVERGHHPREVVNGETLFDLLWAFLVFEQEEQAAIAKARGRQL